MNRHLTLPLLIGLLLPTTLLLSGCSTPDTDDDVYSQQVIGNYFSSPKDPRRFGLTVYQTPYGPIFSGSQRLHPSQLAELKFQSDDSTSLPIIEIRGRNSAMIPTLLDTASRDSWANLTAATAMGAKPLGPPSYTRTADHTTDPSPGYAAYASKIRIDNIHVENAVFYIHIPQVTLGALKRNACDPIPDAVLGCNLLKEFAFVRFDYPEHKLYISSTRDYKTDSSLVLADVPYKKKHGVFVVKALLDGEEQHLIIDTAGDFEIAWNQPDDTPIKRLFIGDICLQDVRITNAENHPMGYPEIPRIGIRLLQRFAIVLDNKRHRIIIERPADSVEEKDETPPQDERKKGREINEIRTY